MALRLDGLLLDNLTADPGAPAEGQVWYNSTDDRIKVHRNGVTVHIVDRPEFQAHSTSTANPHTTTLEQARTAGGTLAGAVNMGGNAINNVGGAVATDAASRQYVVDQVNSRLQGLDWQESVLDKDLATPPGAPSTGDRYIIAAGGTGAWSTHDGKIAQWDGAAWVFSVPNEGFTTRVMDENRIYTHDGAAWGVWDAVVDHGALTGLGDDDHTQYLLVNGSRAMGAALDMGTFAITNVGNVDGVDVSGHAARHNPGGADAVATAAAVGLSATTTNTEGAAASLARSNHTHAIDVTTGALSTVEAGDAAVDGTAAGLARRDHQHAVSTAAAVELTDSTNAEGAATSLARSNHTHAHGNRGGGTLHALTASTGAGFQPQSNRNATVAPTVNDDNTAGYAVGSYWCNVTADRVYMCTNAATASAEWQELTGAGSAGLAHKAGRVVAASFAGTPKKATVSFGAAFGSTNYAVTLTALTTNDKAFLPTVETQTTGGFTINLGTDVTADLTHVAWIAMVDGES